MGSKHQESKKGKLPHKTKSCTWCSTEDEALTKVILTNDEDIERSGKGSLVPRLSTTSYIVGNSATHELLYYRLEAHFLNKYPQLLDAFENRYNKDAQPAMPDSDIEYAIIIFLCKECSDTFVEFDITVAEFLFGMNELRTLALEGIDDDSLSPDVEDAM